MKKLLLTLSTPILALSPVVAVVACGKSSNNESSVVSTKEDASILILDSIQKYSTKLTSEITTTDWVVGSSDIKSTFGIELPNLGNNIFLRAKKAAASSRSADTNFDDTEIEIQIAEEQFTANTDASKYIVLPKLIKTAKSADALKLAKIANGLVKEFANKKSSLKAAALKALSNADLKDWTKIGVSHGVATSDATITIDVATFNELSTHYAGGMVEVEATLSKGTITIELDLTFVSSDFSPVVQKYVEYFNEEVLTEYAESVAEVDTLKDWNVGKSWSSIANFAKDVTEFKGVHGMLISMNAQSNAGIKINSIKVTAKTEAKITIEITVGSSKDSKATAKTTVEINKKASATEDASADITAVKTAIDTIFGTEEVVSSKTWTDLSTTAEIGSANKGDFHDKLGININISDVDLKGTTIAVSTGTPTMGVTGAKAVITVNIMKTGGTTKSSTITVVSSDYATSGSQEVDTALRGVANTVTSQADLSSLVDGNAWNDSANETAKNAVETAINAANANGVVFTLEFVSQNANNPQAITIKVIAKLESDNTKTANKDVVVTGTASGRK